LKVGTVVINWKVRFQNRSFVAAFLSQIMLICQVVLGGLNAVGVTDFTVTEEMKNWVFTLANAIFIVLSMLGMVQDPTTKGFKDSNQALEYKKPK
jgi:phi LC3 family holin